MDWYSWLSKTSLEPSLVYEYGLTFACNELQKEDIIYLNHEFLQSMGISIAKHRLEILKVVRKEIGACPNSFSRLVLAMNKTKRCLTKCIRRIVFHEDSPLACSPKSSPYRVQWREAVSVRNHKSSKENKDEVFMLTSGQKVPEILDKKVEERLVYTNRSPKVATRAVDGRVGEKFMSPKRRLKVVSGPLDGTIQEKLMLPIPSKGPKYVSGPLDGRLQEKLWVTSRSPKVVSGPLDGRFTNRSPKVVSGPLDGRFTNRSPKVSGCLDEGVKDRFGFTNRSPRMSGPLDGMLSPNLCGVYYKENMDGDDGVDSIWATLFQDMKPN